MHHDVLSVFTQNFRFPFFSKVNRTKSSVLKSAFQVFSKLFFIAGILTLFVPFQASASVCEDIAEETNGFFSCGDEQTTLIDFEGGLTPPDASGYAPGLTPANNVRDYVKNIVNFALGFLGLIAVIVVIYGGFMYVTAAGKEDQTEKGKNAIKFAVIGILIILGSYALVNTILQAPTGKETGTLNTSAPGGSSDQNQNRRLYFNYAASAVRVLARDFVTAYQNYYEITLDIKTLTDYAPEKDVKTPNDLKTILQNKKNILTNVLNKAGSLSQVSERAQAAILIIDQTLQSANNKVEQAMDNADDAKFDDIFVDFWVDDYNVYKTSMEETVTAGLKEANERDFTFAIEKINEQLTDLYNRINTVAPLPEVKASFQTVFGGLRELVPDLNTPEQTSSLWKQFALLFYDISKAQTELTLNPDAANNAKILQIVNNIGKLYDLIKDVQFVYAVITTDVKEGNAPFIVNFDALKSLDPNNNTIPDENYFWDFGDPGSMYLGNIGGNNAFGPTATHVYTKPGRYVVKLQIKALEADPAKGEVQAADGIAYQTIIVRPSSARINLNVDVSGKSFVMSEYNEAGTQVTDRQDITITTEEAKGGIIYDASSTETGGGENFQSLPQTGVAKVRWDFGDKSNTNSIVEGPPDSISQKQNVTYGNEGAYRVTLEVTDDRGISDRKIFNVNVDSLAARVNVTPGNSGFLGDEFSFDGSASASDSGQIKSYEWRIQKNTPNGVSSDVTPASLANVDSFKYKFTEAGTYTVTLTVNDGSNEASASVNVQIESKPPVAQFTATNPDSTQPNTFILDGSRSFDPDSNNLLNYKWEVNSAPGECYFLDGNNQIDCVNAFKDFSGDKKFIKPKLKFKKGTYTVTLDVEDPLEPGKSVPFEQQITVENDLDVSFGDDGKPKTAQLKNGSAQVSFAIKTSKGNSYELDTGDGKKESGEITGPVTNVNHTYTEAGAFQVKLSVFDAEDNENSTTRKVFIGNDKTPIAAISASKDGETVVDLGQTIVANRKTVFVFDAGESMNVDGTGRRLNYTWDLGDGTKSTQRQITHTYKELTPAGSDFYKVTLKVANQDNPAQVSTVDEIRVKIVSEPPIVRGITAVPTGTKLTTPLTVNVTANGVTDPDGKIVDYRWWYYDVNAPDDELGLQITQSPNATLTIGTSGEEGQEKTYGFAVSVKDNENQTFDTQKEFSDNFIPKLTVKNGPNKAPIAKFSVDKTSIYVGESITFTSGSSDQDEGGNIVKYIWDFNGNGFGDDVLTNDYNKPNVNYTYKSAAPDGIRVRLKVIDNEGAEAVSDPVPIYVDSKSAPPTAAFISAVTAQTKKVQFTNNSTADNANGANLTKYSWDFDVNTDSNGDGMKDNDIDSVEQSPSYTYAAFGIFRVKLTVEDDQGNKTSVTNFVNVMQSDSNQKPAIELDARLTSLPKPSVTDGKIHLQKDKSTVIFNFVGSVGQIKSYVIDKNVEYDSNGNGIKEDDEDYVTDQPGVWTAQFLRSDKPVRIRLTVIDSRGRKDFVEKEIVFDAPASSTKSSALSLIQGNIFNSDLALSLPAFLATLSGFGIVAFGVFRRRKKK